MNKSIYYVIKNTANGEPIQIINNERDAINLAGRLNKLHDEEIAMVTKVTVTTETEKVDLKTIY